MTALTTFVSKAILKQIILNASIKIILKRVILKYILYF